MTIKSLPAAPAARPRSDVSCDMSPLALDRWNPEIRAAADDDNTISIYDPIGYDYWTGEGVTAKRISAALRSMNGADVIVNINSPGGDVFEGLAIYNLLREHKGKVTVRILGLAASAASFIAMAGDDVQIARAGFLMIHNAWTIVGGNRNDIREVADFLEQIDTALADIYAVRTGDSTEDMQRLMDAETWMAGSVAIDEGFADQLLPSDATKQEAKAGSPQQIAARRLDVILAKQGMPRSERRSLIQDIKTGKPGAADQGTRSATDPQAIPADAIAEFERAFAQFKAAASTVPGV
jgi:ATP-dependent Clp protease, protease subunit